MVFIEACFFIEYRPTPFLLQDRPTSPRLLHRLGKTGIYYVPLESARHAQSNFVLLLVSVLNQPHTTCQNIRVQIPQNSVARLNF